MNMKKITIKLYTFLAVCVCLFSTDTTFSQSGISAAYAERLQHALDSLREDYDVKGMYAAIYIPDAGIWKGVTGVSYGSHEIDTDMLFDIGSTTKSFVAAEIMKLIDEGQFSLDDSIGSLLPPMEYVNPDITVRQLLQHRSGMGEYLNTEWQDAMNSHPYRIWYSPEAMDSFLTVPTGAPGSAWNYRNSNYVLLGMIAESFRSDSLHNILRSDFLTPLQLNDTYMEMFETYENDLADNWSTPTFDPDLAVNVSTYPHEAIYTSTSFAGGFVSAAPDIATWGYDLYSGKIISDTALTEMLTFTPVSGGYFNGYGLGCMRFTDGTANYYGHAGNFFGYAASMIYDPVDSICLALLVNQDCLSPYIAMPLLRIALDNLSVATGVKEQSDTGIKIYPNPAQDILNISSSAVNSTLDIFNISGDKIYTQTNNSANIQLTIAGFPEGVYIVKISDGDEQYTGKFIVKR